ncbi:MAG TPA: hypothetical protein EYO05_07340 [Gammaproteobacteria bacterium]|nr:hypothetical protein [Gammaproteobacteria bacterium]
MSTGSNKVWCATEFWSANLLELVCKASGGKSYSSKYQADAEHKRLKSSSSSSSFTASSSHFRTITFPNGDKYLGELKDNSYHGQGIYTWADGSKYIGEYRDGIESNGTIYYADGTVMGTHSNGEWTPK